MLHNVTEVAGEGKKTCFASCVYLKVTSASQPSSVCKLEVKREEEKVGYATSGTSTIEPRSSSSSWILS